MNCAHHLKDRKDGELEEGGGREGVEECLDDDACCEMQEAEVGVHDGLDADAEEGDRGCRGLGARGLHLPDQEEHLKERDDGDHESVVDALGVVLLEAHVGGVDVDHHATVVAHEGPVHDQIRHGPVHRLLLLARVLPHRGVREPGPDLEKYGIKDSKPDPHCPLRLKTIGWAIEATPVLVSQDNP